MIQSVTRTVYFSPSRGRHYMSMAAAVKAEARALIAHKYPSEQAEYENGHQIYGGFHWTTLPRHEVLLRRVCRRIKRAAAICKEAGGAV